MPIPFPTDGPQVQAALQKVPTPQLQQYAAGQPPQPTGQVTPGPMGAAAGALSQRNAMGAAGQRQTAMQNDPSNSPTIFQQLMMKEQMVNQQAQAIQQQAQMMQQKEQQLGLAGALMTKKAKDLAERERGIAALSMRPDMFTAMDGGIVFRGGGNVQGYASRGLVDVQDREAEGFTEPRASDAPSTTGSNSLGLDALTAEILKARERMEQARRDSMLSSEEEEAIKFKNKQEMQKEYEEYAKGRQGRREKTEAALRGKAPDLTDFLLAVSAGGPGKTFAETLSRMVPGVTKLRTEQQAREMAAAKFAAEAEEKEAQADLAERRGQRAAADKLLNEARQLRQRQFEITKGVEDTGIRSLTSVANIEQKQELGEERVRSAERLADERRRSAEKIADLRDAAFRDRTQAMIDIATAKVEAAKAKAAGGGDGGNQLSLLTNIKLGRLRELNAKKPQGEQLSEAMLRDMAANEAVGDLYGARNEAARASAVRAAVANAKSQAEALSKLKFQSVYIEASPEEKANMERGIRDTFPSTGGGVGAFPLPNTSGGIDTKNPLLSGR